MKSFLYYLLPPLVLLFACQDQETAQPNFIIIMADDLGYGELGCYGNQEIQTPNLDDMASHGLQFTDFHSNGPVCTPTRAALLTGRYQQEVGLEGVIYVRGETRNTGLDTSYTTIAERLKELGYKTGIMGKWHLGYSPEYNPIYHGFDEFYGYRSGNIDYHTHYDNAGIYDWYHNLDSIEEEGYSTDLITRHSIDFIEQHRDEPFFLYIAHEAPHVPFQGPDDPGYRYPDKDFSYYGPVKDKEKAYREMVESMDKGIGEVISRLEDLELTENTLVFFLSDNGALSKFGSNGIFSGEKTELYEGGHRVPGIAYWPGKIEPGVSAETLMSFDLFPTLLSVAGNVIKETEDKQIDGINISSLLLENKPLPDRYLYWRYRESRAVRHRNFKLLINQDTALFDLAEDPEETSNLYSEFRSLADGMLNRLEAWENSIDMEQLTK